MKKIKKTIKKISALSLSLTMALALNACGASADGTSVVNKEADQSQVIYIKSHADGSAYETTIETTTKDENGEDVTEKVKTSDKVPVSVDISYKLDGKEISAEEMAGKSGHLVMRIDYENESSMKVSYLRPEKDEEESEESSSLETGEEDEDKAKTLVEAEAPVPFLAMTILMPDEDVFSNISVTNGRIVSMSDSKLIMGTAFPGLQDYLELTSYEPTEDMDLPSYVEIEADVTDFKLDFTATVFSSGLLKDTKTDKLDDLESSANEMADVEDSINDMKDGVSELYDGIAKMKEAQVEYNGYVLELSSGMATLSDSISAINDNMSSLTEGSQALSDNLAALNTAVSALSSEDLSQLGEVTLPEGDLTTAITDIQSYADSSLSAAKEEAVSAASSAVGAAASQTVTDQLSAYVEEGILTEEQAAQMAGMAEAVADTASSAVSEPIENMTIDMSACPTVSALTAYAGELALSAATIEGQADALKKIVSQLSTIPAAVSGLAEGAKNLDSGADTLATYISQLKEGASQLKTGAAGLSTSGAAFVTACDELLSGLQEFKDKINDYSDDKLEDLKKLIGDGLTDLLGNIRALKAADEACLTCEDLLAGEKLSADEENGFTIIVETDEIE